MSEDFVKFTHVTKAFGPKRIYEDLSLTIKRGETLTLLGGSGTGKSVMLKMLIGLLKPDAGQIEVDGQDVSGFSESEFLPVRKRIAMLFQGAALFDSISVGENVAYPLREHFTLSEEEIKARVAEKLKLVGLEGAEETRPSDLSGGMKKRVGLARAIAADPEMILYDEPTTGLDPLNTRRINDLILSIQERLHVTSLVVTHDMPSAFMVSDRLAMLSGGRIIAALPRDDFRHSRLEAIQSFVNAMGDQPPATMKGIAR